jgi:hypothetical protein
MAQDRRTAKYVVHIDVSINEQNAYGDSLSCGNLSFTCDAKAASLADLGTLLARVEAAVKFPAGRPAAPGGISLSPSSGGAALPG